MDTAMNRVLGDEPSVLRLTQPTQTARALARRLVLAALVLVVVLAAAPWQQSLPGHGRVIAYAPLDRQQTLEAPMDGRVVEWMVEEGGHVAAAEEAIAGTLIFERMKLDRGLIVLGTTGSNAPFVGLFGTVLGIIKAFHDLALSQAGALSDAGKNTAEAGSAVMAGISEALVATAIGLMVAIPAVVLYNFFQRVIKSTLGRTESLAHVVLGRIKSRAPAEA